ncbi:hypothetical protein Taro_018474 [Colocasia esculenta]|uniref:Uncharacterized protein n=1 Tax=Colocasia esculenta TaxID=4460 RepID=A0A843V2H9_COLES|nr:hypothetical protein [Colocasia esculenta]
MVLQRRLDYGFNGCQVPVVPRRPRSARGSCHEGAQASEIGFQRKAQVFALKECSQASSSAGLAPSSFVVKPDPCEEVASAEESMYNRNKGDFGRFPGTAQGKSNPDQRSPVFVGSCQARAEDGIPSPLQFEGQTTKGGGFLGLGDPCCLEEPMKVDVKPPLPSSESSVEVPFHGNRHILPGSSFPKCHNDMAHFPVDRDDDEKSSGCTQPCYIPSKFGRPQRIGDRRIRKLASKFWKVGPTLLKDEELSNTEEEVKPVFRSRKMCYTRQRSQRCYFKRRRLFEHGPISTSDRTISSEGIYRSPEMGMKGELSCSPANAHGGNGASSSVTGQKTSFESDDYHVKLSIKSFKVPELFIELPETATVGSLKRTVVDAVAAILCGGFRVGVLLQGKKVRDDNKTLLQAGISRGDKLESLGFTLEPKPSQASNKLTANTEDTPFLPVCDGPGQPQGRPEAPASDAVMFDACTDPTRLAAFANCVESDHDSAPSPPDTTTSAEKMSTPDCKALVVVPHMEAEALAVVPFHRASRRAEMAPRRIRRPFSVSEVEALVQAVEKLGTGRWRDVKLRAFENAKHRTYVDLKVKHLLFVPELSFPIINCVGPNLTFPSYLPSNVKLDGELGISSPGFLDWRLRWPQETTATADHLSLEPARRRVIRIKGREVRERERDVYDKPALSSHLRFLSADLTRSEDNPTQCRKAHAASHFLPKEQLAVPFADKWKTLVHTAKISPQQRRGEPVPQELLDRVLSANAYWSQHQAKLQVKQQPEQLLLA